MFEEIFTTLFEKNNGIKAIGIWGKDGLELEKKNFSELGDVDLEFSGAEIADITGKLDKIRISPENFFIKLNCRELLLIVYSLTPNYFLMILTTSEIIEGRLKFYLSLYKDQLISSL